MSFVTRTGDNNNFKFDAIGTTLEGYYIGTVDHDGPFGPSQKHVFKTKNGIKIVYGQSFLTRLLATEEAGSNMRITYTGTKAGKTGKPMKVYELGVDETNRLDSAELGSAISKFLGTSDGAVDDDAYADETGPADEIQVGRPSLGGNKTALPNAAAKARVAALVSGRKQ